MVFARDHRAGGGSAPSPPAARDRPTTELLRGRDTGGVDQLTKRVASTTVASRIHGIDMARAIAVVGMVMVHIGPEDAPGADLVAAAYRASHGRASVLFVVLAGIGVSLLARAQDLRRGRAVAGPLLWRSLVLLSASSLRMFRVGTRLGS